MRIHDDADLLARQSGGVAKAKETQTEVAHALAHPKQASVQTMLEVQRLAGNAGVNRLLQRSEDDLPGQRSPVLDVVGKGGGQPLPGALRNEMEGRLGADFSDVKVHNDGKASESARAVQANAYTVGNEVVVRNDRWSPETQTGKETIAHELTHVMQQRQGPVAGTSTGDGISLSDPGDPYERAAEHNAVSAMARPADATGSASASGPAAQLDAADDVQRQVAQRAAGPDEEEAQTQRAASPDEEEAQTQRAAGPDEEEAQTQRAAGPDEEEAQTQRAADEDEEPEATQAQRQAQAPAEEDEAAKTAA
jgi:hypothetical protein